MPLLEEASGLQFNKDCFLGYSPERINPGDKINTLTKIKKVTSGSTPQAAERVDDLYRSIIEAGTHKAPSIKVAEASKAIENAQRDVNRSEEHTSELQSLMRISYAVFCLQKKKTKPQAQYNTTPE